MKNVSIRSMINGSVLVVVLIFLFALSGPACAFPSSQQKSVAAPAGMANNVLSGKVVETMSSGGYTYVLLEENKQKIWVAVPAMKVAVGDELRVHRGNEMGPFTSKSLNRTFDKIFFSGGLVADPQIAGKVDSSAAMPSGHPEIPAASAAMPAGHAATSNAKRPAPGTVQTSGLVVETFDAGGYTYILLQKDGLESWAAVPPVKVKIGEEVDVRPGMEMGEFTSKSLKRTFANIVFSPGIVTK